MVSRTRFSAVILILLFGFLRSVETVAAATTTRNNKQSLLIRSQISDRSLIRSSPSAKSQVSSAGNKGSSSKSMKSSSPKSSNAKSTSSPKSSHTTSTSSTKSSPAKSDDRTSSKGTKSSPKKHMKTQKKGEKKKGSSKRSKTMERIIGTSLEPTPTPTATIPTSVVSTPSPASERSLSSSPSPDTAETIAPSVPPVTLSPSTAASKPTNTSSTMTDRPRTLAPSPDQLMPMTTPPTNPTNSATLPPLVRNDTIHQQWSLRGNERIVYGQNYTQFGWTLAMSADGTIVAVGIPFYPGFVPYVENKRTGAVQILKWDAGTETWNPLGSMIIGPGNSDDGDPDFGKSVDLSSSGLRVAIGAEQQNSATGDEIRFGMVQVYEYNGSDWELLGQTLRGTSPCSYFGATVALSGDGTRLVVGVPFPGEGYYVCRNFPGQAQVHVYDLVYGEWTRAQELFGERYGNVLALAADGRTLAISVSTFSAQDPSSTDVYELDDENESWRPKGRSIETELGEFMTRGTALSFDGSIVAIAAKRYDNGSAFVRVMQYSGSTWEQLGSDIDDPNECCIFYTFENSVAISHDGMTLVWGNQGDGRPEFTGSTKVYEWNSKSWELVGIVYGEKIRDGDWSSQEVWFGFSTAISANGVTIVAGAPIQGYIEAYEYA